ncbi:Radical SAM superfamily protein [Thermomonospora echinospora]|uniref:Radical SAM superfamily protein n=1 Tax=Thermomonospora echinospora TaxID=1992 RepID=A0A1H6E846_9ACTN|nr:radical SAM protein [Thermomonospora echinospora]SEG93867.1 Radical SAM superfamily protein [Thermomonospora echinospora]
MNTAIFAVARRRGVTLVHDPATGLTHRAARDLPGGRVSLRPDEVTSWPTVAPRDHEEDVPISVCWSPLVRCNLSCPHCLDDKEIREQSPAERVRIAELIGSAGVMGVDLSGGEPLLLGGLDVLADILTAAGCVVSVTTNGWHLRRRAPALTSHLDAVRVSLDGPTARLHDAWRGEGSFERAVDGVQAAVAAGLRVQIQTVLMASTCRNAQRLVDLAAGLGAGGVTFLQMLPIGEGRRLAHQEMIPDETAAELIQTLSVPRPLTVRMRAREDAGGFTVIRADGQIWRNDHPAASISTLRPLTATGDLALTGPDGSA